MKCSDCYLTTTAKNLGSLAPELHPVKRTVKKYKVLSDRQPSAAGRFLCGETKRMLFHRGQHAQIALHSSGVVIMDIGLNHLHKIPLAGEPPAIIALSFQNAPEALHRTVINAMRHAGHTLHHSSLHELIDLMVADHDAECVRTILLEMGDLRPSDPVPNPMYRTKSFMEFLIESIEVDVMAGFAIVHEGTVYDCSLREEQIVEKMPLGTEVIPLQSPQ